MTNMSADGDWGARALKAREARRQRRVHRLVAAFAILAMGVPFAAGMIDGITGREGGMPGWALWAMLAGWAAIIPPALWWAWREADEMQRAAAVKGFAVVGLAGLVLGPVFDLAADLSGAAAIGGLGFRLAVLAGIVFHLVQRRRA